MAESTGSERVREWEKRRRWGRALVLAFGLAAVLMPARLGFAQATSPLERLLARAREEVARGVVYDGRYRALTFKDGHDTGRPVYPGGDLDPGRGVCTDVVVRAFRAAGLDLQAAVHEDLYASAGAYATFVARPDANIDHRRVAPLALYFARHGATLPTTLGEEGRRTFRAGDLVVWSFGFCPACKSDHVGLVSDRIGTRGLPLVIHNLGPHPTEEDALDAWRIVGHYRHPLTVRPNDGGRTETSGRTG
jgi:uncharacterized protein YijF (DUF1287 family)